MLTPGEFSRKPRSHEEAVKEHNEDRTLGANRNSEKTGFRMGWSTE